MSWAAPICSVRRQRLRQLSVAACAPTWPSNLDRGGTHQTSREDCLAMAKPDGLVVVDPESELRFLHDLPVELMWGIGPAPRRGSTSAASDHRQLANMPGWSLQRVVGRAAGEKLTGARLNRDPRHIETRRRALRPEPSPASAGSLRKPGCFDLFCVILPTGSPPGCGQVSARPDRNSPRSLRRSPLCHALHNARCADCSDCQSRRNRGRARSERARDYPHERSSRCWGSRLSQLERHWMCN